MRTNDYRTRRRRGSALLTTLVLLTTLTVLTVAFASLGVRWTQEQTAGVDDARAFALAEGGVCEAAMSLLRGTSGDLASLDAPIRHGQGLFWVEAEDIGPLRVRLRSTALVGQGRATVELVVEKEYESIARYALASDEELRLGSNTLVDSYDPANGPYDSQPLNTVDGVPQPMLDSNAVVMSNSDILAASQVVIAGDSIAGPGHATISSSNFYVSGSTEPAKTEFVEEIPPVPTILKTVSYVALGKIESVIPAGSYHYSSLSLNNQAKLRIEGPATLVVDSLATASGSLLTIDASKGPVQLFCTGPVKLDSNSNVISTASSARDVQVYFTSQKYDDVSLASNASFVGALFAPYAKVKVSSNWTIYGALSAKAISMASNSQLHFDESLLRAPGENPIGVRRTWWGAGRLPEELATGVRTDPYSQLGIADPAALPTLNVALQEAIEAAGL
ncbi:MAG TPA: hypothetical protein VMS76_15245 [Planctomycetota bacterium]|nr:hypothetical protein [Planctomycetota bacterium]